MSITDITQAPGFNQQQYQQLLESAEIYKVDASIVDAKLLAAINSGKSFDEALGLVRGELPKLPPPNIQALAKLGDWPGLPAPGALVMALITEMSAEQRQQNKDLMWAQTEAVVSSMKEQASKMRTMAGLQLAAGLISAGVSMTAGVIQTKVAVGGGADANSMIQSTRAQGIGQAISGGSKVLDAVNQFIGSMYQAEFKEMEASQEKMRAMRESMKDLNDSLHELIQKSLSSAEAIQQSKNQATTRILA